MMLRAFGNSLLALFALDALLTLLLGLSGALPVLQGIASAAVILLCPLAALVMVFSRRLPVAVFGPVVLFTLWATLGAMPLPLWLPAGRLFSVLGVVQLAVAAGAAVLWLRAEEDDRPLSWGARAGRAGGLLLGTPAIVVVYAVASAAVGIQSATAGFVGLGLEGVWVAHRTYARDDQAVHLIGMIHIGDAERYPALFAGIPEQDALVLAEGVTDTAAAVAQGGTELQYGSVAAALDLSQQAAVESLTDIPVRYADVDMSDFSTETVWLIGRLGRMMDAADRAAFFAQYQALSVELAARPELTDQLFADILDLRNAHLIGELDAALSAFAVVVVPWGAYHLPEVATAVESRGFALVAEERVVLIPYAVLAGAVVGAGG